MEKTKKRNTLQAAMVQRVADICKLTPRQVRRVIKGDSKNEDVLRIYMELQEGENELIKHIKEIIPFN